MIFFFYILQIQCVQISILKYLINNLIWEHGGQIHNKEMASRTRPRITPKAKFLVTDEAYPFATFIGNISDFFYLCLHWGSVGCVWG